jgi:8-oxo-dGTP pyrophosphatase MutT (NUDIX family)
MTFPGAAGQDELGRRLPQEFLEHARALIEGRVTPAEPRDAATVVLLRDRADGVEAYLLRRQPTMAFASGMYVFPGGSVDPRDADRALGWTGPAASAFAAQLNTNEPMARELVCAAVRETFEESGVLLAGPAADQVVADTSGDDWEAERLALIDRTLAFSDLLDRRGLVLRADLLRAWGHWITPEFEPRRFDTRFFVAALPAGQRTRDVGGEADLVEWVRPADAVDRCLAGKLAMLPPTVVTLMDLAAFSSVAEVLAAADGRRIEAIMPRAVVVDDEVRLVLPGQPGYDQ